MMQRLERFILEIAAAWEKEGIDHGAIRPVIGAVDETFLQRMMLVFMDLATGYLLMEEVAADRSYVTWYDHANARLTTFGTEVSGLKVANPLAGMISPICRQFDIYALMSPPDLGGFASMAVSSSEAMQLVGYTRILDSHL
jgi:hypothetical protein